MLTLHLRQILKHKKAVSNRNTIHKEANSVLKTVKPLSVHSISVQKPPLYSPTTQNSKFHV